MKKTYFALCLLASSTAFALPTALHPYDQRLAELNRLMDEERVETELRRLPITGIQRTEEVFTVTSESDIEKCQVDVEVKYKEFEPGMVGPVQFELEVKPGKCVTRRS